MTAMEKPWKVIVAFVGVFIAGSIFGGLLALRFDQRVRGSTAQMPPPPVQLAPASASSSVPNLTAAPPRPAQPTPQIPLPPGMAAQMPQIMRRYVERLDLTAEQKERVNPLIIRASSDLRRQQQTNLRETGVIIQHLQEDIAKELTPVQRKRLEELAERQRQLIEKRMIQEQFKQQQDKEKPKAGKPPAPAAKEAPVGRPAAKKPVDDGQ